MTDHGPGATTIAPTEQRSNFVNSEVSKSIKDKSKEYSGYKSVLQGLQPHHLDAHQLSTVDIEFPPTVGISSPCTYCPPSPLPRSTTLYLVKQANDMDCLRRISRDKECKSAPTHPYTSNEGAQALCIHLIWMCDAVTGGLEPIYHLGLRLGLPQLPKKMAPTCKSIRHKGAPICPSTAYGGAQTLCIHPIWMCDAMSDVGRLNHDTTMSFGFHHVPNFPKLCPRLHRY